MTKKRTRSKREDEGSDPKKQHSNSDRFECEHPDCGKSFSRKDHLKRHQLNHDDTAVLYKCEECGMQFKRADVKKDHVQRHARNKLKEEQASNFVRHPTPATTTTANSSAPETANSNTSTSPLELGARASSGNGFATTPNFEISEFAVSDNISPNVPNSWKIGINDNLFTSLNLSPGNTRTTSFQNALYDFTDTITRPEMNFEHSLNSTLLELFDSDLGNIPSFQTNTKMVTSELMRQMAYLIPPLVKQEDFLQERLELCLDIYWSVFHIQFPILHKPSFDTLTAPTLLVLAMVMMGACFSVTVGDPLKDPFGFAIEIAMPLRWLLCEHMTTGASEPWELQSLLILEVFEKHYSTRQLHIRSSVHHASKIEMMKRSTLLGGDPYATESKSHTELKEGDDHYLLWNRWIHAESMKRCALMAFSFDLNSLITSGHHASLFVNKLRLGLPCDDCLWEADINTLKSLELPKNPEMVLTALKKLLKGDKVETTSFGKKVMLFAVVSLMIQFEVRDETMSMISDNSTNDLLKDVWRDKISYALDAWKFNVNEGVCCDVNSLLVDLRARKPESGSPYFDLNDTKCKYPSYHMAQIRLRIVNHDMMCLAGSPFRMSVKVDKKDYRNVENRLKKWANSLDGKVSVVHAYSCLIECLLSPHSNTLDYSPELDPVHERAHVINACSLIIWCYNYLQNGPESNNFNEGVEKYKEDAHSYFTRVKEVFDREIITDGSAYEYHMSVRRCAQRLPKIDQLNNLAGYFHELSETYGNCYWEMGCEYARLYVHCKDRCMGKEEPFSDDMYRFNL